MLTIANASIKRITRCLIEIALAHIDKDEVRGAYNRADYIKRRRPMMAWWSGHIQVAATDDQPSEKPDRHIVAMCS